MICDTCGNTDFHSAEVTRPFTIGGKQKYFSSMRRERSTQAAK